MRLVSAGVDAKIGMADPNCGKLQKRRSRRQKRRPEGGQLGKPPLRRRTESEDPVLLFQRQGLALHMKMQALAAALTNREQNSESALEKEKVSGPSPG